MADRVVTALLSLSVALTCFSRGWLLMNHASAEGVWPIGPLREIAGALLMLGALAPFFIFLKGFQWLKLSLLISSLCLFVDSLFRYQASGFEIGNGIEHTLQWACPLLLYWFPGFGRKSKIQIKESDRKAWLVVASVAVFLTFVGHGIYAYGLHPVPQHFLSMTTSILGTNEVHSLSFLKVMGFLDFVFAIGMVLALRFSLIYMFAWGGVTALARVLSQEEIHPSLFETLVRTSHWMVPLAMLVVVYRAKVTSTKFSN